MEVERNQVLERFGINPETVPSGTVNLVTEGDLSKIGEARSWIRDEANKIALAYEIETERNRNVGVLLRNLHMEKELKAHLSIIAEGIPGPFWHNLTPALPQIWKTGVAVLVEGPKDARVLFSHGIQAVAYLGISLSKGHLQVMRRYAHTIFWVPDREEESPNRKRRVQLVERLTKGLGLFLRRKHLAVKDAGEMANKFDLLKNLKDEIYQCELLGGGGYVGH